MSFGSLPPVPTPSGLDPYPPPPVSSGGGGGGSPLEIDEEGVPIETAAIRINFIGAGVTATSAGGHGVDVTIPGGTVLPVFTPGSVIFASATGTLTEDNPNAFWDDTNNRLGIGTNAPERIVHVKAAAATHSYIVSDASDTAMNAAILMRTNNVANFHLSGTGSTWAPTFALASPSQGVVDALGSGGLLLMASHASGVIKVATGGIAAANERMRVDASGGINVGGASDADTTAVLELESTTRGFLPPKMTTTQRDAIATPATGLVIFNTTLGEPEWYDGTRWIGWPITIQQQPVYVYTP